MDDEARPVASQRAPAGIELRHLRAFVAVAEELNFGRAADRLFVSQPALSRQIRALEQQIGCSLLRRSTHSVNLTPAGNALLDRARQLLVEVDDAVAATQSAGGELAARVAGIWAPLSEVTTSDFELQTLRAEYEQLHARFAPPDEVTVSAVNAGGVPAFALAPSPKQGPPELLYLHGGGYVMGSAYGFRHLVGALVKCANVGALVPEYRLAPEHPFPAALEDALRAYEWMLDRAEAPGRLVVAGDSTGGGLVLSLLLLCREQGLPLPGAAILFSPHVDLTGGTLREMPQDHPEAALVASFFRRFVDAYLAGHPVDDPLVAPLATSLEGLPPMLIQAAEGDHVLADARRLAEHARECGVYAQLDLYPGTTHAFQIFWSFLPEALQALESAGSFIGDATLAGR